MTNNEETEQSPFKLPERTINLNENQYTTAQLVSNSLKLVNDDSLEALTDSKDRKLLLEQANLNAFRSLWLQSQYSIKSIHKSKRFVEHTSILEKCLQWTASNHCQSSVINFEMSEILTLELFPETFFVDKMSPEATH
ncbi:unnamed protein product [Rotaria magnacalcarata]|uniref:Uncharacterized protein n=1 Tax=Rotaria magnacalcarata TaxID=392030 RepID=A0A820WRE9_9BILA|nr:unnamed protein product [Rotaria magnacalcarata]CAF4521445.1 unnamed protein product [Rotaria magnacalcarata]